MNVAGAIDEAIFRKVFPAITVMGNDPCKELMEKFTLPALYLLQAWHDEVEPEYIKTPADLCQVWTDYPDTEEGAREFLEDYGLECATNPTELAAALKEETTVLEYPGGRVVHEF